MLALMCIYFSGCLLFTPARWHFSRVKIQHKGCSSKVFPTLLCHFFPHWSWQRIKWMCWDITGKSDVFLKYIGLFLKILFIYFYTEGKGGRKRGRETLMCCCPPPSAPLLGTCPTTQACALTGNGTDDPLVCSPALNPLIFFLFCFVSKERKK